MQGYRSAQQLGEGRRQVSRHMNNPHDLRRYRPITVNQHVTLAAQGPKPITIARDQGASRRDGRVVPDVQACCLNEVVRFVCGFEAIAGDPLQRFPQVGTGALRQRGPHQVRVRAISSSISPMSR